MLSKLASLSTSSACWLLRSEARSAATIMANGTRSLAALRERMVSPVTSDSVSMTMRRDRPVMSSTNVEAFAKKLNVKLISRTTSFRVWLARMVSLAINSIMAAKES